MKLFLAALLGALSPPQAAAPCDALRQKSAELRKDADAWLARHAKDCPLCAGSTACREGFERQDAVRRQLEDWKKGHAAGCPTCSSGRCNALENAWSQALVTAQGRHKEQDRRCELDPARCDAWRRALEAEKARHEDLKRDHPALCEKCSPSCEEWRKRCQEVNGRANDTALKHRDKCQDCQRGAGCERASHLKQDWTRERLAAWKKHGEICACARSERRR
jgi:hypothetical protein